MDIRVMVHTEVMCTVCKERKIISIPIYAESEAQAIEYAATIVNDTEQGRAFNRKHSKHRAIDAYNTIGAL